MDCIEPSLPNYLKGWCGYYIRDRYFQVSIIPDGEFRTFEKFSIYHHHKSSKLPSPSLHPFLSSKWLEFHISIPCSISFHHSISNKCFTHTQRRLWGIKSSKSNLIPPQHHTLFHPPIMFFIHWNREFPTRFLCYTTCYVGFSCQAYYTVEGITTTMIKTKLEHHKSRLVF